MDMWYSEDHKVVSYPCADNKTLNFVCIHPAELSAASDGYNTKANRSLLLQIFQDFDPIVQAMLNEGMTVTDEQAWFDEKNKVQWNEREIRSAPLWQPKPFY